MRKVFDLDRTMLLVSSLASDVEIMLTDVTEARLPKRIS